MALIPPSRLVTVANSPGRLIQPRPVGIPLPLSAAVPRRGRSHWTQAGSFRGRPIHLTATCVVAPSSSGSPNNQALHSPVLSPIEIHDIKFAFSLPLPGAANLVNYLAADGGSILCQLALNDEPITDNYVPIWSFDESTNIVNEQTNGATLGAGSAANPYSTTNYGEFTWHLPRALYLRPADQFNVSFQNLGQQAIPATCRVSLSGCVLENTTDPKTRILPFVSTYVSKVFALDSGDSDASTETDLANTTNDVINLHKLTGRVDNNPLTGAVASAHFDDSTTLAGTSVVDLGLAIFVQMYTGRGTQLVPYNSTFRDLFGPARAVPISGTLQPGDYIIAALTEEVADNVYGQVSLSMIGWREVSL